jgi:hypothetical protein
VVRAQLIRQEMQRMRQEATLPVVHLTNVAAVTMSRPRNVMIASTHAETRQPRHRGIALTHRMTVLGERDVLRCRGSLMPTK